jgi:hypothetical protein
MNDTIDELPVPELDPRRVEAIRARAHRVLGRGPTPPAVRLEAATASLFSVAMLVWAASSVVVFPG